MNSKPCAHEHLRSLTRRGLLAPFAVPFLWSKSRLVPRLAAQNAAITPTRFSSPQTLLTPTDEYFVRNHFNVPKLPSSSTLRISGLVHSPFEISPADLARQPVHTVTVTTECAGNAVGGVSTADWDGVPLATL